MTSIFEASEMTQPVIFIYYSVAYYVSRVDVFDRLLLIEESMNILSVFAAFSSLDILYIAVR